MPVLSARIALDARDQLGEGPVWDGGEGRLVSVDISRGRVHAWRPGTKSRTSLSFAGETGAVILRAGRPGCVVAVDRRLVLADGDERTVLAEVEGDLPANRFNDCRADPQGRIWAGTMSRSRVTGSAGLYRLEPGGSIEAVVTGTTISNGLGWSPDGETMYFVDSTTQRLDAFDFHGSTGELANRRTVATVDTADGLPDGLAIDADGGIWLALFGGGAVRRYSPQGHLDAHVPLPVTNPTCPAFGGAELTTLFLTSARHRLSDAQLEAELPAGAILALDAGVAGLPTNRYAG